MATMLDTLSGVSSQREQKTPNGVTVIPYNALFDKESDKFLPWFWQRLKEDGLVSLYYPGQEDTGFAHFVRMLSGGAQVAIIVANDDAKQPGKPIGFVSWEPLALGSKVTASAGFIFLKEFWDHKHSTDAANAIMKYWFTQTDIEVVLGIIASENHLAQRFMKRIGWNLRGTLPGCHLWAGKSCDATIWCITKENY